MPVSTICPRLIALAFCVGAVPVVHAQAVPPNTANCLTANEAELARLTNEYRVLNALTVLPVSFSLSSVAQWHVWDLEANDPVGGACNLHSWSNARPAQWQPMCYTPDHAQAQQMWDKPRQITDNAYNSNGYEISAFSSGPLSPLQALNLWKGSPGHNDVILNRNGWAGLTFRAMGVGMFQGYAVIWFGTLADPLGTMSPCATSNPDRVFAHGFEG